MSLDLPVTRSDVLSDIRFRVFELFAQNNIEIGFLQQEQHIDGAESVISEASTAVRN
jgi:small-conductance mechanosensitive channel